MTASHVFRKAEKIAIRRHLSKEVRILKAAMDLLSHHEVATAESIAKALDAACPAVQKMIGNGDIILKNKDERAVFSDTAAFSGEVSGLCTQYSGVANRCREEEESLQSHPVQLQLRSLEREKEQLKPCMPVKSRSTATCSSHEKNLKMPSPSSRRNSQKNWER